MSTTLETLLIVIGSMSLGVLIPMFWKKVLGTKYMTFVDFGDAMQQRCTSCLKDTAALKADIIHATTEDRRLDMRHFKEGINEKLSKIMGILLIVALKKDGESLKPEDRDKIIDLVTSHKDG